VRGHGDAGADVVEQDRLGVAAGSPLRARRRSGAVRGFSLLETVTTMATSGVCRGDSARWRARFRNREERR